MQSGRLQVGFRCRRKNRGMLFVDDSPGRFRIPATVEQLLAVASVFWAFTANRLFLLAALNGRV